MERAIVPRLAVRERRITISSPTLPRGGSKRAWVRPLLFEEGRASVNEQHWRGLCNEEMRP